VVLKRSGRRVPFDREKLVRSVEVALRKRIEDPEVIEKLASRVVRRLEALGEPEVSTARIGEFVMDELKAADDVAYVRFASVYRNFREAKDFEAALAELTHRTPAKPAEPDE
jgi:transcriptional repressor NrdR